MTLLLARGWRERGASSIAKRSPFGSVRRLPSGRWQARFTVPGTDKTITAPITLTTRTDAKTWLSVQRADLARGTRQPASIKALTFREYAERWLTERDLRPRTVAMCHPRRQQGQTWSRHHATHPG